LTGGFDVEGIDGRVRNHPQPEAILASGTAALEGDVSVRVVMRRGLENVQWESWSEDGGSHKA
jgi:hypothetical protein